MLIIWLDLSFKNLIKFYARYSILTAVTSINFYFSSRKLFRFAQVKNSFFNIFSYVQISISMIKKPGNSFLAFPHAAVHRTYRIQLSLV